MHAFVLTCFTLIRVLALILLASLVWVPLGILIGLNPRLAERVQPLTQFLAAFPANVLFPIAVVLIVRWALNPDIWLSFLIIFGTQWYILFNVVGGASAFPNDLREAAATFHVRGWDWWTKVMLPGRLPLLCHRRADGLGRLVERGDRRRICQMGQRNRDGAWHRRLYRQGDGSRRLPAHRARRRHDVDFRDLSEPLFLAAALALCRAPPAAFVRPLCSTHEASPSSKSRTSARAIAPARARPARRFSIMSR